MRRPKLKKVKFDSSTVINVMIASLLVQKAPLLIDMIFPLDPSVRAVAGVGAGYLVGMLTGKSEIANASIAIGAVDFVTPFVDDLLGGSKTITQTGTTAIPGASGSLVKAPNALEDYLRLNDYISQPIAQVNETYRSSY